METEVQQLHRECAMLRERCVIWEKEVRACQQRELRLQAKLARAEVASEIVSPSKRISDEHARAQLEKEVSSLQAMLVALRQDSDRRDVLHKKLETELELSAEREATLRAQLRQALTNSAERRAEIEELSSLNASLAEAVKGERRAKEEARDEVARMHELLEGKEACVSATEEQCRVLDETIAEERAFLEAIDKDLVDKAEQLDGMREAMAEKEAREALREQAVNRELQSLAASLEERNRELGMLNELLEERELHLDELRQALRSRDQLAGKLKRQLEAQETAVARAEAALHEAEAALREQGAEIRELQSTVEERAGEVDALHQELAHQEEEAGHAAEEAGRRLAEAARREEEAVGTSRQQQLALASLQEQLDEARSTARDKGEALVALEGKHVTAVAEVKALAGVLLRVLEGGMLGARGGNKGQQRGRAVQNGLADVRLGGARVGGYAGVKGASGYWLSPRSRASSERAVAGSNYNQNGDRLGDDDEEDGGTVTDDGDHHEYGSRAVGRGDGRGEGKGGAGGTATRGRGGNRRADSAKRGPLGTGLGHSGHEDEEEEEDGAHHDGHDDEEEDGEDEEEDDEQGTLHRINDAQMQVYLQRLPEPLQVPFAALAVLSTSVCDALAAARARADLARAQAAGLASMLGELEELADVTGADASGDNAQVESYLNGDFDRANASSDVSRGGGGAGRGSVADASHEGGAAAPSSLLAGADASRVRRMVAAVKEHCRRLVEEREGLLGALEAAEDAAAAAEDDARHSAAMVAQTRRVAERSLASQQGAAEVAERLRRVEEQHRRALTRAQDLEAELQRSREHTHTLRRELQGCYARELAQHEQAREWARAREGLIQVRKAAEMESAAASPLAQEQRSVGTPSREATSPLSRSQVNHDAPAPSSAPAHTGAQARGTPLEQGRPRTARSAHSSATRARSSELPSSRKNHRSVSPSRRGDGDQRQASREDGFDEVSLDGFVGSPVKRHSGGHRPRTPEYLRMEDSIDSSRQGSRAVRLSPAVNRSHRR